MEDALRFGSTGFPLSRTNGDRPLDMDSGDRLRPIQVLVVAREPSVRSQIASTLNREGFQAVEDTEGLWMSRLLDGGLRDPHTFPFQLVILESHLCERGSLDLCQLLRFQGVLVPVLWLSDGDRVLGLERGADACLTTPFDGREFIALCRSLLRRFLGYWSQFAVLNFADLKLDVWEHRIWLGEREIELSPQEFRLLSLLMKQPGRVWTRSELLDRVWKGNTRRSTKTVDVHVSFLRKKIEVDPKQPRYILTVPGRGYVFGRRSLAG